MCLEAAQGDPEAIRRGQLAGGRLELGLVGEGRRTERPDPGLNQDGEGIRVWLLWQPRGSCGGGDRYKAQGGEELGSVPHSPGRGCRRRLQLPPSQI